MEGFSFSTAEGRKPSEPVATERMLSRVTCGLATRSDCSFWTSASKEAGLINSALS
ncbi:hypothetical protein EVA_10561 [gut metagenome]|uniref:Uncharacterized protein n=1 Tax=gut metagenome TaxID=749906 RepID=J9G284_9ZZZZ